MRVTHLIPLLLTLACSEYGFGVPRDHAAGAPDDPSEPVDPEKPAEPDEDQGRPPGCDDDIIPKVQRMPWTDAAWGDERHGVLDFDADGRMIGVRNTFPFHASPELVRYTAFGDPDPLGPPPGQRTLLRTLADGRIAGMPEWTSLEVFDPQNASVHHMDLPSRYCCDPELVPAADGTLLLRNGWTLARVDPSTGETVHLADDLGLPDFVYDYVALSRSEETIYVAFVAQQAPATVTIYAVPYDGERLGRPEERLPPTQIPPVTEVQGYHWFVHRNRRLAVDACEHLYILTNDALWTVRYGEQEPRLLFVFPYELEQSSNLFWGPDAGYADPQTLYVVGYETVAVGDYRPVRFAIHLGVDGNHVLSR